MKILLLTHVYPPAVDGGSRVIAKIGDYLRSHGNQILVLTTNCRSTDDFVNPSSSTIIHHQSNILALSVYKNSRRLIKFFNLFLRSELLSILQKGPVFKILPYLKALITVQKFHPDLIIAGPLPTTIVLYSRFIKFLTRSKLLINASFHPIDPDFSRHPLLNTLKKADFIWTLTDFETNYFHEHFVIPFSKMIPAGNGVDKSLLSHHTTYNTNNLLFIGSFAKHKNVEILIDSFSHLPPNSTLTLAGQKTLYFPIIEAKIRSLPPNIKSRINVVTNFPDRQLKKLIDACTILISPSFQESFGLVLLEAWARKKPVIAADIPASSELIVKSGGGLMFKTGDSRQLTHQINLLLADRHLQRQLGQQGFKYVQSSATWDKIGQALWSKISSSSS